MQIFDDISSFLKEAKQENKKPVIAIVGPTASGKTALSLRIAEEYKGEIISADSRQVYKYMDIGTDKIPVSARKGIPHYLIDIVEPNQEFTVADFKRLASKAITEIHQKSKLPVIVGGTGLYINVITQNYQIPQVGPDMILRNQLNEYYRQYGAVALHELLKAKDPETAAKIHPNNVVYVIRALEILTHGEEKNDKKSPPENVYFIIGIDWPREKLYERINGRVDELIEKGLVNEVKTLLMKGYNETMPSMSSLGYLELIDFLKGNVTLAEAIENIKKNTRNFCKRQLTWFRRNKDIHWISGPELEQCLKIEHGQ